jgi:hypothetical protein
MGEVEEIKKLFEQASKRFGPAQVLPVKVISVNGTELTAAVEFSDGSNMDDVRLKAVIKEGDHYVMLPVVGSYALVARIENTDEYLLLAADEVSDVVAVMGEIEYGLNAAGMLLKKDDDTLLIGLTKMVEAVQQIVVMYGNNPDYAKLTEAKIIFEKLLR